MSIIAIKGITILLVLLGIFLFAEVIRLARRIRKQSRISVTAISPIDSTAEVDELAAQEPLEHECIPIPKSYVRSLVRAITQANAAGYDVINRLEKADLRVPEEVITIQGLSEKKPERVMRYSNERGPSND